jgi:hypothetical protein
MSSVPRNSALSLIPAQPEDPVFHRFRDLPYGLRALIWGAACSQPMFLSVGHEMGNAHRVRASEPQSLVVWGMTTFGLYQACTESHHVFVQTHRQIWFSTYDRDWVSDNLLTSMWINARSVVFLEGPPMFERHLSPGSLARLAAVGVAWDAWTRKKLMMELARMCVDIQDILFRRRRGVRRHPRDSQLPDYEAQVARLFRQVLQGPFCPPQRVGRSMCWEHVHNILALAEGRELVKEQTLRRSPFRA